MEPIVHAESHRGYYKTVACAWFWHNEDPRKAPGEGARARQRVLAEAGSDFGKWSWLRKVFWLYSWHRKGNRQHLLNHLGANPPPLEERGEGGHPIIPDEVGTQRAPAPPQPRGRARPGATKERKGLRQRLTRSGRGSCRRAVAGTPRERLDWRGMCRGVREPNEVRQTAGGSPEGVSEANQTSRHEQMP